VGLRLGFACAWDPDPVRTWSHTPWRLRAALRAQADVVDVGVEVGAATRLALKLASARWRGGRPVSAWKHSAPWSALCQAVVDRDARRAGCDAVLQVQDLAAPGVPFFVLQDLSYDVLLTQFDPAAGGAAHFPMLTLERIRRRRERQRRIYDRAAGVLAMSRWFAGTLVELTGLPGHKVHVVHPGVTASRPGPVPRRVRPRTRLLLVGRDFYTKGGDLAVAALAILRRDDRRVTLTVAGPDRWPLPGGVPEGVRFLGRLPAPRVAELFDHHDLLVMPSRLEGFGIVFVEALARGLPCIGRDAFAMPELIVPGRNGGLVRGDDPAELAAVVATTLEDDRVYETCMAEHAAVAARFSWDRAASDALAAIGATFGAPTGGARPAPDRAGAADAAGG
jgi:glycosyltransferase involved in cell wall biosynthesis